MPGEPGEGVGAGVPEVGAHVVVEAAAADHRKAQPRPQIGAAREGRDEGPGQVHGVLDGLHAEHGAYDEGVRGEAGLGEGVPVAA